MYKIYITNSAHDDLKNIGDFIKTDNPERAKSFIFEIKEKIMLLKDFPRIGYQDSELPKNILKVAHGNFHIFYKIKDMTKEVFIFSVKN